MTEPPLCPATKARFHVWGHAGDRYVCRACGVEHPGPMVVSRLPG